MDELHIQLVKLILHQGGKVVQEWERPARWYRCTVIMGDTSGASSALPVSGFGTGQTMFAALCVALMNLKENAEKQLTKPST